MGHRSWRSNLSLSPEDSWLPIASILLGIFHVQLESSIKNGDIQGFKFFNETGEHISSIARKMDIYISKEEEAAVKDHFDLPSSNDHSRDELGRWGTPKEHSRDLEELDDNAEDADAEGKH
ncbi:hypothetical protein Leryth_017115 [Lithospermum erythrorhizon]|nr:hypothetical protein Leryth_017115 [Lithospermum erythrorhizon]